MTEEQTFILAGDIGGTKTELALYPVGQTPRQNLRKLRFPSQDFAALEEIVAQFLAAGKAEIVGASFGVAGPVVSGVACITNLPWIIEARRLERDLGVPVGLINDMDAIAHTVAHIDPDDMITLLPGTPVERGARAIIAPGTGLGEGFLVWSEGRYLPFGSEGGHTDFAPRGELQKALLTYLEDRFGHISYERVCSGIGLPNLYAFLKDSARFPEPDWLARQLSQVSDPTPVIAQAGLEARAQICVAALDLFLSILGSEAGNLSLKILATGGVFIAGGIPRRLLPLLQKPEFKQAFIDKGRFSEILNRIPVHVIINPEAALLGAAWHALNLL